MVYCQEVTHGEISNTAGLPTVRLVTLLVYLRWCTSCRHATHGGVPPAGMLPTVRYSTEGYPR